METEEYLQTFTSPTFTPSLVSGILFGFGTVALYDKAKRNGFYRPYFHLANAGLVHAVAEMLNLVYDRDTSRVKNDFPLHASLILTTVGAQCLSMMLHRFLDTWVRIGLNYDSRQIHILLGMIIPLLIFVAFSLNISGDILLVVLDERADPSDPRVAQSLSLKLAGTIVNILIILMYLCLGLGFALTTKAKSTRGTPVTITLLLLTGLLGLLRFGYYCYLVAQTLSDATDSDIFGDVEQNTTAVILYHCLIILPEILLMLTAIVCDLTRVQHQDTQLLRQTDDGDDTERALLKA